MSREGSIPLKQLSLSLKETIDKMEKAYEEKNIDEFNRLKDLFFQIQEKIV